MGEGGEEDFIVLKAREKLTRVFVKQKLELLRINHMLLEHKYIGLGLR